MRALLEVALVDIAAIVADSVGDVEGEVVASLLGCHLQQMQILLLGEVFLKVHVEGGATGKVLDVGSTMELELVDDGQRVVFNHIKIAVVAVAGHKVAVLTIPLGVLHTDILGWDHLAVEHYVLRAVFLIILLDEPEDALEALAYAIKSKWTRGGDKRRHLIVVWSDASTHPIGYSAAAMNYPRKMVKTFDELTNMWDGDAKSGGLMDSNAKRLLIFAPEVEYWTDIAETWDNVIHFPSEAGSGLDRLSYQEILAQIINSIA